MERFHLKLYFSTIFFIIHSISICKFYKIIYNIPSSSQKISNKIIYEKQKRKRGNRND